LISVPFQNNTNLSLGTFNRTQDVLNIQPLIPANISEKWMVISRIIQPIIWQPYPNQNTGGEYGLGDMVPTSKAEQGTGEDDHGAKTKAARTTIAAAAEKATICNLEEQKGGESPVHKACKRLKETALATGERGKPRRKPKCKFLVLMQRVKNQEERNLQ
jgi:hypothetical protein